MRPPDLKLALAGSLAGLIIAASTGAAAVPAVATPLASTPSTVDPVVVVAAPGFPGSTAQAQPTMDLFARALAAAAKRPPTEVATSYYETEAGGTEALGKASARYALVPLPFFLKHADGLALTPRLLVDEGSGTTQPWSLVAARGQVPGAGALGGWEILGTPGYAPGFVRLALQGWGAIPADTRITPTTTILSALRRASGAGKVAVFLDRAQAAAMPTLPFAPTLEVVATSEPLPSSLFCTVGTARGKRPDPVLEALPRLHDTADGAAALAAMRMKRFVPLDPALLPPIRAAYAAASASAPSKP